MNTARQNKRFSDAAWAEWRRNVNLAKSHFPDSREYWDKVAAGDKELAGRFYRDAVAIRWLISKFEGKVSYEGK